MTYLNIANLVAKANVDVIGMKDFTMLAASQTGANALSNRMSIQQQMKSNLKQLVIDSEDNFTRNELSNISGLSDILMNFLQMCASAGQIPLTKFLGTSVAGFGTGDNEIIEYYDNINSMQTDISPQLRMIDEIMERNLFGENIGIDYSWVPLLQADEVQSTGMELQRMQTDIGYIDAGVLTPQIAAQRLKKEGNYDGITPEFIEELSDEPISAEDEQSYQNLMSEISKSKEDGNEEAPKNSTSNSRKPKRGR